MSLRARYTETLTGISINYTPHELEERATAHAMMVAEGMLMRMEGALDDEDEEEEEAVAEDETEVHADEMSLEVTTEID